MRTAARKIKTYVFLFFIFAPVLSCLKDTGPVQDFSKSPALVGFQYTGNAFQPFVEALLPLPDDTVGIEVTLSVSTLTLTTPVQVTIVADDAEITSYDSTLVPLDPSLYSLNNSGKVTINPGQQIVPLTIHFSASKIDFSKKNAIALKITGATGATVASNLNLAIIQVVVKSIYEGNYNFAGNIYRYNGATEASGLGSPPSFQITGQAPFSTLSVNSIDGTLPIPGFATVSISLVVNADNTVTINPSVNNPTVTAYNNPLKPSTYDSTTKVFNIHGAYISGSGALREFDTVMTFQ